MSVADSAVGAILEIPPQALDNIQKAENAIKKLASVSAEAAGNVNLHWGEVATTGLQKFIDKLTEAKTAMNGLGTINVTLNTQAAVQSTEQLSTATQKTSSDVSKAAQDMAQSYDSLAKVNISGVASIAKDELLSIEQIKTKIKELAGFINVAQLAIKNGEDKIVDNKNLQRLTDEKKAWEELLRIRTTATEVKDKALSTVIAKQDKDILTQQNQLLKERLDYEKKLNELQSNVKVRTAKGGVGMTADENKQLDDYSKKIADINSKLVSLGYKYNQLSVEGQEAFRTNQIDNLIAKQEANIRLTDREAEALRRLQEAQTKKDTTNQNKKDKEYLEGQKRLLADILDLRKQVNGQKIVVSQGQVTGSSTLEQDKKVLSDLIARLYEAKDKLKEYNAEKYKNVSAEGQAKAQINTLNQENALIKEQMSFRDKLNTAIARGNELTAQTQASKARLGNTDEAIAQRQLNSDYKEMLKIIKEMGEIKAKVASEGRQMNQSEINLIATLAQRYKNYYDDVKRVEGAYTNMAQASAQAFQNDKSLQLARNATAIADANDKAALAAQKVAETNAKKSEQSNAQRETASLSQQNSLLSEQLRLQKQLNDLVIKKSVAQAGGGDLIPKDEQRITAYVNRLATIQTELDKLGKASLQFGEDNKRAFDTRAQQAHIAMLGEESRATTKLASEMQRVEQLMQTTSKYPSLANAVLDTSAVERKRQEFINAIKGIEGEISKLNPKFQEALTAKWNAKSMIDSMTIKDIQTLQQHINQLGQSMIALSQAQGGGWHPNMQPVLDAINQFRAQIQQIKTESANLLNTSAEAQEVQRLLQSYDQLYEKIRKIQNEQGYYDAAKQKLDAINQAVQQQIQKITDNEVQIERLNQAFVRLNATQKAYDASGNLTSQAKNIYDKIEALKEENRLLKQNATEAGKDNVSKNLSRYKELESQLERIKRLQEDLKSATGATTATGTSPEAGQFNAYVQQRQAVEREMRDIEMKNITEVNQYRQQKDAEAFQASLSAFVQAEAQKTAEAKKQAEQQSNDRIQAYQKFLNSYQGAMTAENRLGTRGGQWEDTYENRARVIKNLEAAIKNLNKADADYERKLKDLTDALVRLKEAQKSVNNALRQKPEVGIFEANQARKIAEQTKTLKDYETAYKMLIEAMNTTPQGNVWNSLNVNAKKMKQNIDDIKKKMGEFHKRTSSTSNVMGQLQGRIAAAFSVSAISGFVKKVTEVRAQFELQRVALGAIIQDRDEANKIFTQVQNMALESPFNIMQLEKATKQIAAFGFETKKLVPTMKMFADISAGLGVEIDRLVLVMGHLKARNFLEGTMVRQFTNMGFNVLGELSKYYTELEGKMVSVGEVQDRVKKKMVSFEDVEEVLKRVTSAGGMFYDMQKKQSDSIWGQMQRIQDAYDLMLNEIGQSNEGTIKNVLTLFRNLINSWRILVPIIKSVGVAIVMYFAISRWGAISAGVDAVKQSFKNMGTVVANAARSIWGAKSAQDALNASQKANAWGLVISLIIAATVAVWEFATAQSKLNESMNRVRAEGIANMYDLIVQYKKLADTVKDTTKTYEERKEAMDNLNRVFKDILPNQMLEIDNIRKMKDGYKEATEAIRAYSAEKIKANLKSEIENIVSKDIVDATGEISAMMTMMLNNWGKLPDDMKPQTFRSMAQTIITEFTEEVKNGSIPIENAIDELKKRMVKRLEGIVPKESIYKAFTKLPKLDDGLEDWYDSLQKYVDAVKGIDLGIESPLQRFAQPEIDRYEALEKAVSDYINALKNLREEQKKGGINGVKMTENGDIIDTSNTEMGLEALQTFLEKKNEMMSAISQYGINYKITADDINNAIQSNVDMLEYEGNAQYDIFTKILNTFSDWGAALKNNNYFLNWLEEIGNKVEGIKFTGIRKDIADTQRDIIKKFGLTEAVFDKFKWDGMVSYSDVQKQAKQLTDEAKKQITEIANVRAEMILLGYSAVEAQQIAESRVGITEQEAKDQLKAYGSMYKAYGGSENDKKSSKKSSDAELKRWQDLKKAIEDVRTAYEKYRKSYNVEESNARIEKLFGPTFKELGSDIRQFYKDGKYDANGLIDALEVLKGMTKATTEERKKFRSEIERKIGTTQVEIEVKMKEDAEKKLKADLDEMFANYELAEELKKLGVSVDLAYMVGGKPTTLEDIRNEIAQLRAEGGDKEDAENRIKILEDAEKKITQMELKAQKERLKNYEKYLKTMYSDRAKTMIESYTTLEQMERDFQKNIQTLESEMHAPDTSDKRKKELAGLIASLRNQAREAAIGIQRELNEAMAKADWNSFKGSEIFESMYQDLDTLSKKGIDALIQRLETVRDKLQSVSDIDPKAVREVTQYIEKLKNAKIKLAPYAGFRETLSAAKELKKEYGSIEKAQLKLVELNDSALGYEQEVADLETIIALLDRKVAIEGGDAATTTRLNALYEKYKDNLQDALATARQNLNVTKEQADKLGTIVNNAKKLGAAYQAQISKMQKYRESVEQITNAVFEIADALGGEVDDEWKNLASSIINATFQGIQLQLQMQILQVQAQLLGVEMNSALGIIGWVAIALQVVASLLTAIFAAKDKRLQKKIEAIQDRVDTLSKSFEKLQKSIERAFTIASENRLTEQALNNLEAQKSAYEEMIRLEEAKKKSDDDKIKEYKEKLEELAEAEEELYEKRHEKYGSTDNVWDEANNWVDAWLDAYKETGDGLDSLNDSWDEFYENLVKKQATSAIVGSRMKDYIDRINAVIDSNMDEYGYVDAFKEIGEAFKADSAEWNKLLKEFFEYAGIKGGSGDFILSDLQKGIQNITEPQAAAIEAYLNSMRFAVFRHTEQLDTLIATIQMQYGNGAENPVVTELKGIRSVLDRIDSRLSSVINTRGANPALRISGN